MPVRLHRAGVEHARELIENHQSVKDSDWSEAQPSADEENDETTARYTFPYGDFRRVPRSGLVAAKQRAGEWIYDDVETAADRLLQDVPEA
jgi:hypothetical protein